MGGKDQRVHTARKTGAPERVRAQDELTKGARKQKKGERGEQVMETNSRRLFWFVTSVADAPENGRQAKGAREKERQTEAHTIFRQRTRPSGTTPLLATLCVKHPYKEHSPYIRRPHHQNGYLTPL